MTSKKTTFPNTNWRRGVRSVGHGKVHHEEDRVTEGFFFWMHRNAATKKSKRAESIAEVPNGSRNQNNKAINGNHYGEEEELHRLRVVCQRQEQELLQQRSLNEEHLEQMEELRQDNELLTDRLRYAHEELELLGFLHTSKEQGSDSAFEAIGSLNRNLTEVTSKRAGNYQLEGLLGKGAFGRVWSGRRLICSLEEDEEVAIKEVDKSKLLSTRSLARVNLECAILRDHANQHPNIIGYEEIFHAPKSIYMVMEKADGSLVDFAGHQKAQPDFLQQVLKGVLKALVYLHQRGIAHGDIDPQNILIKKSQWHGDGNYIGEDAVRLCDFGLAHDAAHQEADQGTFLMGKAGFLAPELVQQSSKEENGAIDYFKADMWSLGCTLMAATNRLTAGWFECFRDRHNDPSSFQANIADRLEKKQQKEELDTKNQGDAFEFDLLFNGLLQIHPESRLSSVDALEHPWFQESKQPSVEPRPKKTKRGRSLSARAA